jgi:dTDP-4-amino-4,6-dideoxygalactose transaminase
LRDVDEWILLNNMVHVPYLDLKKQHASVASEISAALAEVCNTALFAQGPVTAEFEREFAAYCDAKHCVSVNSGTDALHLAVRCLDIGPGDDVITTPFTFIASAWAITYVGARPVFVDIDPIRRTLDPVKVKAAITRRTKAILPVHIFGTPADIDALANFGVPVVEDSCQAHGARYKGQRVRGCFSFYPTKNLGAYGEAGALVIDDDEIAAHARSLRDHGQRQRYIHEEVGYNYRMDSFQAAVLRVKLKRLDSWNAARTRIARRYTELLTGTRFVLPTWPADSECVWHCYVIECDDRDRVRDELAKAGIGTALNYPLPLHLQPVYRGLGYKSGDLPLAERLCERCLSLPIFPELTDDQIETVVNALLAIA